MTVHGSTPRGGIGRGSDFEAGAAGASPWQEHGPAGIAASRTAGATVVVAGSGFATAPGVATGVTVQQPHSLAGFATQQPGSGSFASQAVAAPPPAANSPAIAPRASQAIGYRGRGRFIQVTRRVAQAAESSQPILAAALVEGNHDPDRTATIVGRSTRLRGINPRDPRNLQSCSRRSADDSCGPSAAGPCAPAFEVSMDLRWTRALTTGLLLGAVGCALPRGVVPPPADRPSATVTPPAIDDQVRPAGHRPEAVEAPPPLPPPSSMALPVVAAPPTFDGPQPVDVYIRRALAENREVRAAWFNLQAMKHRIPQVTALDDPTLSNAIFPIPAVAPQYSLMGYMPYDALLSQQFPWFGTLRLRGEEAAAEVRVALFELAAAQLDAVAGVKRAYYDLYAAERTEALLVANRGLAEDFLRITSERYKNSTARQADVLRAETAIAELDRRIAEAGGGRAAAQADLAQLLHAAPSSEPGALVELPPLAPPAELDRLRQLAVAARPELRGRLAALDRDAKAIELARRKYYPDVTLGLTYQQMEEKNAEAGQAASGVPNVGLFVGLSLPIYRKKLDAGVFEAKARAAADAQRYEADRDRTDRDVRDAFARARVQGETLAILRRTTLPNSRQVLKLTAAEFESATIDYLGLLDVWREVIQVEVQVVLAEAELGKALADLERAVGLQINEHPPQPSAPVPPADDPAPPPEPGPSPFAAEAPQPED